MPTLLRNQCTTISLATNVMTAVGATEAGTAVALQISGETKIEGATGAAVGTIGGMTTVTIDEKTKTKKT